MPHKLGLLISYSLDTICLALISLVIFQFEEFQIIVDKLRNNILLRKNRNLISSMWSTSYVLRFKIKSLELIHNFRRIRFQNRRGLFLSQIPRSLSLTLGIFQSLVFENRFDVELALGVFKTNFYLGFMFETRLQFFARNLLSWLIMQMLWI